MHVVTITIAADHLAKQDGAAVAEARIEAAELVAGIHCRDGIRAIGHSVAGDRVDALIRFQPLWIDTEQLGQFVVDTNQCRVRHRHRCLARVKALG